MSNDVFKNETETRRAAFRIIEEILEWEAGFHRFMDLEVVEQNRLADTIAGLMGRVKEFSEATERTILERETLRKRIGDAKHPCPTCYRSYEKPRDLESHVDIGCDGLTYGQEVDRCRVRIAFLEDRLVAFGDLLVGKSL